MTDLLQANRDAGIREAECEKAAMDVKYSTDTKIEDNSRAFKLQKANFDMEVNTAVSWKTVYFKNICLCDNERSSLPHPSGSWQIISEGAIGQPDRRHLLVTPLYRMIEQF
jgi:hypothetical protein